MSVSWCKSNKYWCTWSFIMSKFRQFVSQQILTEKKGSALNADLIFQKLLDVLDHGHLDFDDDRIEFHVGRLTKNSSVDLRCVIRNGDENSVRLGKNKETGEMTVVVDTTGNLPARSDIDSFLAKDRSRAQGFKGAVTEYLEDHHGEAEEPTSKTGYEDAANDNTSVNFEARYEQAVKGLREQITEFRGVVAELDAGLETEDYGKKETIKAAKKQLAKEYFGEDCDGFKKVARGLMSKDEHGENTGFANNLSKENKDRLDSRLESFYDQHIKPLFK